MGMKGTSGAQTRQPWSNDELRAWARRVVGRTKWQRCGQAMAVLQLLRENETLTKLAGDLALERDELKARLEELDDRRDY